MKKIKIYLIAILSLSLCFSCLVDDEVINTTQDESGPRIVGFKEAVTLGNFVQETGAIFDFGVPVHYLGGNNGLPSGAEISTTYELGVIEDLNLSATDYARIFGLTKAQRIDLEDENSTTELTDFVDLAIEGTHYDFVDTVREATIPADLTFDLIDTVVYNDALDPNKITFFVIHLKTIVTDGNVVIGEQLKSTIVKLQLCRTDLAGSYLLNSSGAGPFFITSLGGGDYEINTMMGWSTQSYTSHFFACAGQLIFTDWVFSNEIIQEAPGFVGAGGTLNFPGFGIENVYSGIDWVLTPQ